MSDYICVGHALKAHSTGGELRVLVEKRFLSFFMKAKVVFMVVDGLQLPYFVEESTELEDGAFLKLEEVDSREAASALANQKLYMQPQDLPSDIWNGLEEEELLYAWCIGYTLVDDVHGVVGCIESVQAFPQQEMAVVLHEGREVLIPLHDDLIREVDEGKRYIYMTLPSGLLSL